MVDIMKKISKSHRKGNDTQPLTMNTKLNRIF